ncbi:protein C19orf12 homolog [Apis laboriosa]|uniref:protein C19orf12 homolog n=1 Tax=Apis laboriosa TaxID=183418 RepID=UPI001CC461A1|nr:protein C19orf12 homolog [Apis laboriosa]
MDFSTNNLLEEVLKLDVVKNLKVSVQSSVKYGTIVGLSTIAGGIVGGPIGLSVGGILSSLIATWVAQNEFKSVPYIVWNETTPEQRRKLAKLIIDFLNSKHIKKLKDFVFSIPNDTSLQEGLIQILISFLFSELNMYVKQ